jgi:N-acylneuraminate cytidylyltransferase/CMP-N,N'-diacetyllegionaminic acid synthase
MIFDVVALIQPTSPFLRPGTIDVCLDVLEKNSRFNSAQSITPIPHNYHAWNQRKWGNEVEFVFKDERKKGFNKQTKPEYFIFGNFVATRVRSLKDGVFAEPSYGHLISREEAIDIDTAEDLRYAEYIVGTKIEKLKQLKAKILEAEKDQSVRILIITGEGKAFCAVNVREVWVEM